MGLENIGSDTENHKCVVPLHWYQSSQVWGGYSFSKRCSLGMRKGRESSKTRVSSDNSQVVHVVFLDDSDEA